MEPCCKEDGKETVLINDVVYLLIKFHVYDESELGNYTV